VGAGCLPGRYVDPQVQGLGAGVLLARSSIQDVVEADPDPPAEISMDGRS
jgi:hypothetical protein